MIWVIVLSNGNTRRHWCKASNTSPEILQIIRRWTARWWARAIARASAARRARSIPLPFIFNIRCPTRISVACSALRTRTSFKVKVVKSSVHRANAAFSNAVQPSTWKMLPRRTSTMNKWLHHRLHPLLTRRTTPARLPSASIGRTMMTMTTTPMMIITSARRAPAQNHLSWNLPWFQQIFIVKENLVHFGIRIRINRAVIRSAKAARISFSDLIGIHSNINMTLEPYPCLWPVCLITPGSTSLSLLTRHRAIPVPINRLGRTRRPIPTGWWTFISLKVKKVLWPMPKVASLSSRHWRRFCAMSPACLHRSRQGKQERHCFASLPHANALVFRFKTESHESTSSRSSSNVPPCQICRQQFDSRQM